MYSNYGYDYGYSNYSDTATAAAGLTGFLLVLYIFTIILSVAAAVVTIIGLWKMFVKAGRKGWEAIIPYHDEYVLFEMAGINPVWVIWVLIASAAAAIPVLGWIVAPAFLIFVSIWSNIKLAKQFGKETGFGVLMAFFPFVMYPILGFGPAKYTKPAKLINKPGEDK